MTLRAAAAFLLVWALFCLPAFGATGTVDERVQSNGRERTYTLHVPASASGTPAPVVVLLHGSGGRSREMVRLWTPLAEAEGIVLVAPTSLDADAWHLQADGPQLFHDILAHVAARHAIDRRRVYLFGHSGGAVYALMLGLMQSESFAAVAVHAGTFRDRASFNALGLAKRKIPVALFIGDIDEFFSLRSARATERALREAGHPTTLTVLKRHGHGYARVATAVNAAAWQSLESTALPN
jgi:poly(3-hydroxybutyrate) depolymerase